jgi:hypothetical protein
MEKESPRLENYNPVFVPTHEEAEAWSTAHPEVPVKVVPAPLENVNVIKEAPTVPLYESVEKPLSYPTE